ITEEHALAWRTHLEARSLAPATIARKLAVARGLFAYLADLDQPPVGLPSRNPFRRIRPPRFDRTVGKTPCPVPEEVRRLLRTIGARTARRRRDLLVTLLLFNQGLRISEVARLERCHVQKHGKRTYLALVGKGGSEIRSVLPYDLAALLERHLRSRHSPSRFVFTRMDQGEEGGRGPDRPLGVRTIRAKLKDYVLKAGLDPAQVRPHSGRVFFITQSYLKTRDLERVARAVGHRELATTRRYLRLGSALEDHPAMLMDLISKRR
ncbi:MAG TPA: site-specific integrase, partial [Planctomycetota bacterium]|nr:site-specific integrase [Planctomycetota bacterium]